MEASRYVYRRLHLTGHMFSYVTLLQDLHFAIPYTLAWYIPAACSCLGVIVFHYQFKDLTSDDYTCYADVALQKPVSSS